ncbi:MAG: ABC transporter ATP-binding protein [Actinomycetota bacterium]
MGLGSEKVAGYDGARAERPGGGTDGGTVTVMISLRGVSKQFPNASGAAVENLSLDVNEGEIAVLVGPSGCGKTTTMRMINRLIEPSSGSILVDGTDVMSHDPVVLRRGIGYVIQSIGLLPHRTVEQNIATVPALLGWDHARIRARVVELTGLLGFEDELLKRYPSELSGGQRQRVGVARALAADPPVMLMDEPFAAVDPIIRAHLQDQFLEIQRRLRKTIVFVTHDIDEAIKMADRIAILNIGAKVEQYAPPEEILRAPASEFVARFVGTERGLKRLALISIADVEIEDGPTVSSDATRDEAQAVMWNAGTDWVTVVENGRVLGWIDRVSLDGRERVRDVEPRPFAAIVNSGSSLRQALDVIVTSRTHVAVVVEDGDRYQGIITLDRLTAELRT